MTIQARLLLLLLYVLALHTIAIFFFTSGFLLTRTELPNISSCNDVKSAPCNASKVEDIEGSNKGGKCWTVPGVKRVIIVIIDALRFDFVAKSSYLGGEPQQWMDNLPVLQRIAEDNEADARIFKYVADPPTTTLQRLKGLTTGGLPTFIDVGRSFGAPEIVEDNLILQLAQNGKRVVMMGDDTWLQLFPKHFSEAFPFPSLNVKDLHTVDNGVISQIFPALQQDNWDVLIAHFLGVDHVGHIFGVESPTMVEKLEQYNTVIESIVSVLRNESHPGGLHERTLLIVMGDHGQTLHGDHGGGTAEEVETALFAMSMRRRKGTLPADLCSAPCNQKPEAHGSICITTLPQLDFACTLATLLGVPIPFGNVGRVNPELFSLAWPLDGVNEHEEWLAHYQNVLCINSWQVKRYLEQYAASALGGIPAAEIFRLNALYEQCLSSQEKHEEPGVPLVKKQISGYSTFLNEAASLARSQWTQFGDVQMAVGLMLLILSIPVHALALLRAFRLRTNYGEHEVQRVLPGKCMVIVSLVAASLPGLLAAMSYISPRTLIGLWSPLVEHAGFVTLGAVAFSSIFAYLLFGSWWGDQNISPRSKLTQESWTSYACDSRIIGAALFVTLHALSLLSNSFIMAEGHVASFLLASIGLFYFRRAIQAQSKVSQAIVFLVLNRILTGMGLVSIMKDTIEVRQEKSFNFKKFLFGGQIDALIAYIAPLFIFIWLAIRHFWKSYLHQSNLGLGATFAVPVTYAMIVVHWLTLDLSDLQVLAVSDALIHFVRLQLPRFVYLSTLISTGLIVIVANLSSEKFFSGHLADAVIALLGCWGGSILLLLGRKGPLVGLLALLEVWCIMELQGLSPKEKSKRKLYSPVAVDWNLLAVLLFFCTNHRCTFDGLRYPAAFIGFDEFNIYRQGALLAVDTYGVSHILPIVGLPLLVTAQYEKDTQKSSVQGARHLVLEIAVAYLSFGLVRSITTTFSTICVALQRRHLMVWGLFAPKFVFDAIGLLFTDVLFVAAAGLYFSLTTALQGKTTT